MSLPRLVLALGCLLTPAMAQTLTVTTSGTVPRIPGTPFIPRCPTTLEPYYYSIRGTIDVAPPSSQEIRLLVKPVLLDGSNIPGCTWVSQCQRAFVLPDNSYNVIGQFGTNNVPRSWFTGQRAEVMFALIDRSANVPVCISNPAAVSIAVSNITQINTDPTLASLHDFAPPCTNVTMGVTGVPNPGQTLQFTLPSIGAVVFGLHDTSGFPVAACQVYMNPTFPLTVVSTNASGLLSLTLPTNQALIGVNVGTQGVSVASGTFDATQPTYVSIR